MHYEQQNATKHIANKIQYDFYDTKVIKILLASFRFIGQISLSAFAQFCGSLACRPLE